MRKSDARLGESAVRTSTAVPSTGVSTASTASTSPTPRRRHRQTQASLRLRREWWQLADRPHRRRRHPDRAVPAGHGRAAGPRLRAALRRGRRSRRRATSAPRCSSSASTRRCSCTKLAHLVAARGFGLHVRSITLHLLGGETAIDSPSRTPVQEFVIAVVGPLASIAIGVACFVLDSGSAVVAALAGSISCVGVFNLLPGLPLDGGRALRATIWQVSGRPDAGTRVGRMGGPARSPLPWSSSRSCGWTSTARRGRSTSRSPSSSPGSSGKARATLSPRSAEAA